MTEEDLDRSLKRFIDELKSMNSNMGNAPGTSQRPRSQLGDLDKTKKSPAIIDFEKKLAFLNKQMANNIKLTDKEHAERNALIDAIEKEEKAFDDHTKAIKNTSKEFMSFGKQLLMGSGSAAKAFESLGNGLSRGTGAFGKSLGRFASGVGFMIGQMQSFADDARQLGGFADLGAFKVGSIRQAKIMSGLGESFNKVIEQSEGGFKAFGKNSQESVEALSQLSRGFITGSKGISSSLSKNLGPELTKTMDKAAEQTAALGLSQEEQASLMGALSSTIALTAKSEKEAQAMMVKQYTATTESARTLSNTFGTSAKEILKSIEEFKRSTSGKAAELARVEGAGDIKQALAAAGVKGDLDRMALAMAEGNYGAAQTYVKPEDMQNFSAVAAASESARAAGGGVINADNLAQGMQGQRGAFEQIYQDRSKLRAAGQEGLGDAGTAAGMLVRKMDLQAKAAAGDMKAKAELDKMFNTSEASNIKSMANLADTMNMLRTSINWLTAGLVGLTGALLAPIFAGGLTAIATGSWAGGIGKKLFSGDGMLDRIGKLITGGKAAEGAAAITTTVPTGASGATDALGKAAGSVNSVKDIRKTIAGVGKGMGEAFSGLMHGIVNGLKALAPLGSPLGLKVLLGATVLSGVIAILGAGVAAALYLIGKGISSFAEGLTELGKVDGFNLIAVGAGLTAVAAGMLALGVGLAVAGVGALFIIPGLIMLRSIMKLGEDAGQISLLGAGIKNFGDGLLTMKEGLTNFNGDALTSLKDKLLEFAQAGSSDEVKQTAEYLAAIGNSLTSIGSMGGISLPSTSNMSIPDVSVNPVESLSANESLVSSGQSVSTSALTPEALSQLMSYLADMQNDLAAIRGNTKGDMFSPPVRLS